MKYLPILFIIIYLPTVTTNLCTYTADHALCRNVANLTLPTLAHTILMFDISIFNSHVTNPQQLCQNMPTTTETMKFQNTTPIEQLCAQVENCNKRVINLIGCDIKKGIYTPISPFTSTPSSHNTKIRTMDTIFIMFLRRI